MCIRDSQKPCCRPVILLQDRQQQMAGIGFFAAKVPGKLHRTAQQLIRLVRKALVPVSYTHLDVYKRQELPRLQALARLQIVGVLFIPS